MIELVSVRVENFRSFTEATFTPAAPGDGLTAITGRNGAGKSTIIHAILWALYGETPHDVPVRGLRRQGSTGPVVAHVTFRHDGQTIDVTRSLRGKNDTTTVNIEVDKVQQTVASVRAANEWLTNRLNLDARSFLTAFVVRQKELDALITDRPADRRKLVERLAGIERMHDALTAARANANELTRAATVLPDPEDDPDTLRAQAEEAHRRHTAAQEAAAAAQEAAAAADEVYTAAEHYARLRRQKVEQRRTLTAELNLTQSQIRSLLGEVDRLHAAARDAESLPHHESLADSTEADLRSATEVLQAANLARRQAQQSDDLAQRAAQSAALAAEAADFAAEKAREAQAAADAYPPAADIEAEKAQLAARNAELAGRAGEARNERKRVAAALPALVDNPNPTCPTCSTHLTDPQLVVQALRAADADAVQVINDVKVETDHIASRLAELADLAKRATQAASAAANAADRAASLAGLAETGAAEAATAAQNAAIAAAAADEAEADAADLAADMDALRAAAQDAARALASAQAAAATAAELPEKEAELHNLQGAAEALQAQIVALPEEDGSLADSETERDTAWHQRDTAIQAHHTAVTVAAEAAHAAAAADAAVQAAVTAAERKTVALAAAEKAVAAAAALDEFRKDRLARLAPELSEVASDFVARMTEGKYVTVELDDNFTPTLTDSDGNERAASWLSGGEESAVALALRVAIGEVLSGNRGGMLVLDEVLTAQDASRRTATMAAIGELPRQTIAINHVAEATDMADYVIEVVEDGEAGSQIVVRDKHQLPAGSLPDPDQMLPSDG